MTPTSPTRQPQGPKARLLHIYSWGDVWTLRPRPSKDSLPCLVIPNPSRPRVKFDQLSWEKKVAEIYTFILYNFEVRSFSEADQAACNLLTLLGHAKPKE